MTLDQIDLFVAELFRGDHGVSGHSLTVVGRNDYAIGGWGRIGVRAMLKKHLLAAKRPDDGLRSPEAIARDEWLESEEGRRLCEGSAGGQYLQNRLEAAFAAGAVAGRKLPARAVRERLMAVLDDLVRGDDD